jgi:hypothetical protein
VKYESQEREEQEQQPISSAEQLEEKQPENFANQEDEIQSEETTRKKKTSILFLVIYLEVQIEYIKNKFLIMKAKYKLFVSLH